MNVFLEAAAAKTWADGDAADGADELVADAAGLRTKPKGAGTIQGAGASEAISIWVR